MPKRLLFIVLFLTGCTSGGTVVKQELVKCPPEPPSIVCVEDVGDREGQRLQVFLKELRSWGFCWKKVTETWQDSWKECP